MEPRTIRVFISSTFRDMNAERDHLNSIVFPQIEQYCKRRFLSFIPIDLRWGIPEEYSRNGLVLSACMEEIDKSRPFFIGILGSRYGWNPQSSELNGLRVSEQQQNWIKGMSANGASITEMEIEYGVLRDMNIPYASFFIRSDKLSVPDEFKEEKGSLAEERLKKLKQRIRNQQKYPVIEYNTVEQFGEMIQKQLIEMIETEYPLVDDDEANSIIAIQEHILERRSKSLFDIQSTFELVTRWISEKGRLLMIEGDSGSGTSTVLAYCVSELRKKFSRKIIYFDFETIDDGPDSFDLFSRFLSLNSNMIPNGDWGMIAIDNVSVLNEENESKLIKWLDELSGNIAVAMAMTNSVDLCGRVKYRFKCPSIMLHGLSNDQKKQFINSYTQQYGKRLSSEQLENIVSNADSKNVRVLEMLMRLLVNFGSFEHLNERISSFKHSNDHFSFWVFYREYESLLKDANLDKAFINVMTHLSLTGLKGITESELLEITGLSQAEWSVLGPIVRLACKGNANCLSFVIPSWETAMRDCITPYQRSLVGMKMINWYLSDKTRWKRCARTITYVFNNEVCWWADELGDLKDTMFAVGKSPDMIKQLKDHELGPLWSNLSDRNISDNAVRVYGRSVEELSAEEAITYYMRLAKVAKSQSRGLDIAYCYVEISKIKEKLGMADADFYRYRSMLEKGHPEMCIFFVDRSGILQGERREWLTGRSKTRYTIEQQLYAHLVMFEAFILKGDFNNASVELQSFRNKAQSLENSSNGELRDIIATGYSFFAYVLSGYYTMGNNTIAKELLAIVFADSMKQRLDSNATYFKYMAWACLEYQAKSYENMLNAAWWAMESAQLAYGAASHQYARARLMYAFAHYQLDGDYGIPDRPFKNVYPSVWFDYSRSFENKHNLNIEWNNIETSVKNTLFNEYMFFWNMERSIQPVTEQKLKMEKRKEEYRKSIGL